MKHSIKTESLPLTLVGLSIAASIYFYINFPDMVPTHWNLEGQPDQYSSKTFAAFLFPIINIALYFLFLILPHIDPKKDHYQEFSKTYNIFRNTIISAMTLIYITVGLIGLGNNIPVNVIIPGIIGVIFVVMGLYMDKIKPNWFMGVRTPWTLSSETVWTKTHKLASKLFVVTGLVFSLSSLFSNEKFLGVFIFIIIITALTPGIYSYILYRKEKRGTSVLD